VDDYESTSLIDFGPEIYQLNFECTAAGGVLVVVDLEQPIFTQ